jgi:protein TonB
MNAPAAHYSVEMPSAETDVPRMLSVLTLVILASCLLVGFLGIALPYSRPQQIVQAPPPVIAQVLNVELARDVQPLAVPAAVAPDIAQPPPPPDIETIQPAPAMITVAAPSPQIAFAVPVEIPAVIVPASEASYRMVEETPVVEAPAPAPPAPQPLVFGRGEGKQPAPEYPRQALREGQEGIVTVRFNVGEDGRVLKAVASQTSPWPLLNDAAVRVVRQRWRFSAGANRYYEVAIRFKMIK